MPRKPLRRAPVPSLLAVGAAGVDLDLCMAAVSGGGDKAAFGRLVQHFAPRLIGFFAQGGAPRAEAEELALETLATLWREAALYDRRRTTLGAFVFVIARNLRLERAAGPELACAGAGEGEEPPPEADRPCPKHAMASLRAALGCET